MFNQSKNKFSISKLLDYRLTTIIFILVLIMLGLPLLKNINRRSQVNFEINKIKQEMEQTERNNSDLQNLLKYLDSAQFTEEQARLNLGFKKDGEEVVVVKGLTTPTAEAIINNNLFNIPVVNDTNAVDADSNLKKWQKYFFK